MHIAHADVAAIPLAGEIALQEPRTVLLLDAVVARIADGQPIIAFQSADIPTDRTAVDGRPALHVGAGRQPVQIARRCGTRRECRQRAAIVRGPGTAIGRLPGGVIGELDAGEDLGEWPHSTA